MEQQVRSAPYAIDGTAIKMLEVVNDGIVCVTNTTADFVSMDNGKSKLDKPLHYKPEQRFLMAHAKENNSVGFFIGNTMYEMNYRNGTVKEILDDVKFKGADNVDKIPNFFEAKKKWLLPFFSSKFYVGKIRWKCCLQ